MLDINIKTTMKSALIEHEAMGAPGKIYNLCSDLAYLLQEALTEKKLSNDYKVELTHGDTTITIRSMTE